ncbi:MAG: DegT/DnrJ/EryC1/StrS family aminotransferase [Deltaproteobacteria bacterium]|nr:DegT/DnrJ/EryC1/StrS family aminotransferase [Candidatus Zymogenaceae bacterium]
MKRIPTNSFYQSPRGLITALRGSGPDDMARFEDAFAAATGSTRAFLVGSGTTALFVILKALSRLIPERSTVILPAYTVPTLTLAIQRAGLTTNLCDVDPATFNLDPDRLGDVAGSDTLAVMPVHMFGFPMDLQPIKKLAKELGFFVIEDAAQAPGASIGGRPVGGLSEAGLFSLCKGKIISTFRGGVATVSDSAIADVVAAEVAAVRRQTLAQNARIWGTLALMSGAVRPEIYGPLYRLIAPFKSTTLHDHFEPTGGSPLIARLGMEQLASLEDQVAARRKNGDTLHRELSGLPGVTLPRIQKTALPSYNHLPIVVDEPGLLVRIRRTLFDRGVDTARMYLKPIHRIYDLGYPEKSDPFPFASRVARGLMVLPTHPGVREEDLETMIQTIRSIAG